MRAAATPRRGGLDLYLVDIDTGGTMTDTLVSGEGEPRLIKVESTPHDITVSFMQSLESAAELLGFTELGAFLEQVRLIRWSSTLTSNVLAERKGPKLGLIVSEGHAGDLYADDPAMTAQVVPSLVRPEHITTLPAAADRGEIVAIVKNLIDQGIRRVNISLKGAFPDGSREQEVLQIIAEQFPDHFLGSVPALAGSEMLMRPDDMSRTFFALINAYVHNALANSLFKAEDAVKVDHDWRGDLLVGHLNGGVARIGKTKAVDTIESGPLFGTHASAHVAREAGLSRVLAIDIGGTTGKASAVTDGRVDTLPQGHFFGIPVRTKMPVLRSSALGGGSIARVEDGALRLGPESMGAAPGPACYGLGGGKATLTDALVLLGAISPTAFLNGRRVLDTERAAEAIGRDVAEPLGIDTLEAAGRIFDKAVEIMAALARATLAETGWAGGEQPVLFAYGGNGPLFATAIAEQLGLEEVRMFAFGTIFSAYGSAIADVLHVYERALVGGAGETAAAARQLHERARRDLGGEGFDPDAARQIWALEGAGGGTVEREGEGPASAEALLEELPDPQLLRLEARFHIGRIAIPPRAPASGEPSGRRQSPLGRDASLPVYAHDALYGAALAGPCVVDGGTFTWLLGVGWDLSIDARGDGVARRRQ